MHIRDLKPDPANARRRTPRSLGMIGDSIQEVGVSRSIVIDEDDVVRAGNGLVEAAAERGITKVQVVEADGETIIAVRRRGLTEAQKTRLALYDNRAAELAEWSVEQLAAELKNGEDLTSFFYPNELAVMFPDQPQASADHWQGMPEFQQEDLLAWKSVKVNFNSAESLRLFAALVGQPLTENTRSIWYPEAEIGRFADKRYTDG